MYNNLTVSHGTHGNNLKYYDSVRILGRSAGRGS